MPAADFHRELLARSDRSRTWEILTDVARIADWVSVVGEVTEVAPLQQYRAVLADRLGPFRLKADLDVRVPEVEAGSFIRVTAAGEDRQVSSRISVDAVLRLEPAADERTTMVVVEGHYEVVGRVASMGAGIISQKAQKILDEFFTRAASELG